MLFWSNKSKSVGPCVPDAPTMGANSARGDSHAVGSNYTTSEVTGNGGKKMSCESQGDFWQFLENVAEVITRLWWSAIWASCWDPEMCGGQNKMFDALRRKKKAWASARGIYESCRKWVPVGALKVNDNLNLYLQQSKVQQNNEPVYQGDDLLLKIYRSALLIYNIITNITVLIFRENI